MVSTPPRSTDAPRYSRDLVVVGVQLGVMAFVREEDSIMSLKAFHVVFVLVSMVLSLGFGAWAIHEFRAAGDVSALVCGIGSFAGFVMLMIYGRWFLRKLKGVSYL